MLPFPLGKGLAIDGTLHVTMQTSMGVLYGMSRVPVSKGCIFALMFGKY